MSKNLFRKGLAIGAATSLTLAGLVGIAAPAQAAGELKIEPNTGTLYGAPTTNQFALKTSYTGLAGETAKLKYAVTSSGYSKAIDAKASSTLATAQTAPPAVIAIGATSAVVTPVDAGSTPNYLVVEIGSGAAADASTTVGVQAFIDNNLNGAIDSGEWTSNTVNVEFITLNSINWSVDIVDPVRATNTATAYVTSSNVNLSQLTWRSGAASNETNGVVRFANDTATQGTLVNANAVGVSYNSTDNRIEATSAAFGANLDAGDSVRADFFFSGTASLLTTFQTAITAGTGIGVVEATKLEAVAAAQVTAITQVKSDATSNNTAVAANAAKVRTGATALAVYADVTYATGVTGAPVTFTVSEASANSLAAGATISGGGKSLTNSNSGLTQSVTIDVTADADGRASLSLSLAGLAAGNTFTVQATAQGYSQTAVTYTVESSVASALLNLNAIGTNGDSAQLVFPVGSGVDMRYVVWDQYNNLLNVAGHTVSVSDGTNSWTGAVSNGLATVSIPAYSAATTKTMTPTVLKNGVDVVITEPTASVRIGTANAAASVTGTGATGNAVGTPEDLNVNAYKAADTRLAQTAPTVTAAGEVVITGQVKDSALSGTNASVTLSSPGLLFEADGVWSIGSITVQTTSTGTYTASAYSNQTGKHVVTITAGSASVLEELWFKAAAGNTGASLDFSAPKSIKAGRTLVVAGTLTDAFGNPVQTTVATTATMSVSYDGPGYIISGGLPTSTDADGKFSFRVLLGVNETGPAITTVTYGAELVATTDDVTFTSATWVGPIANASAGANKGVVVVDIYRAKGQSYTVLVGGKVVASGVANKANYTTRVTGVKSGARNVVVRLKGGTNFSGAITVK